MCGIHLIVSNTSPESKVLEALKSAKHRGPDSKGTVSGKINDNFYTLGHTRLQISGDESHVQPMSNDRYDFAINGEIYNSGELQTKYKINPLHNDSYVLFHLLNVHGLDILSEVNGMFSFVWIDKEKHKVHLVRDSSGQKPLYFSRINGFTVSSELGSFLDKKIDQKEIKHYLNYKYTRLGNTICEQINEVIPGTILTFSANNSVSENKIALSKIAPPSSLTETILKAVSRHSIGINDPAVLLSGGLDSSIVLRDLVALGKKPVAYTIDTGSDENPDLTYAVELCKKLGVEHKTVQPKPEDFQDFIRSMDHPVGDGAFFFNWVLAREIHKDGYKVAFTGNGADELFGGYNRHLAFYSFNKYKTAMLVGKKVYSVLPKFLFSQKNKVNAGKFFGSLSKNSGETFMNFSRLSLNVSCVEERKEMTYYDALEYDRKNYLVKDIFSLSDQAGMSFSVEIRSPFMDASLLNRFEKKKIASVLDVGKNALRQIYGGTVLGEISKRKKIGFGIPFMSFFGAEKLVEIEKNLHALNAFLGHEELKSVERILENKSNEFSNEYWALLILVSWLKLNR